MSDLYIIDGTALVYRSYYGFIRNPLINSTGLNTSGMYGFITTINKLVREFSVENLAIALDKSSNTFRHKIYKEYKATREKMPDDLRATLPYIYKICNSMGLNYFEDEEYEADDILASLADKWLSKNPDSKVYIVTRDKDLMQLLDDRIFMIDLHKDSKVINGNDVYEKFGVNPVQIIDFLALMGDAADNIPGVKGIGKKRAKDLLAEFVTLEGIYENIEKIKAKKVKENLQTYRDDAFFSKQLVTIKRDIDIDINLDILKYNKPKDIKKFNALLDELELKTLKLNDPEKKEENVFNEGLFATEFDSIRKNDNYKLLTFNELDDIKKKVLEVGYLVFDTETTSLDIFKAELVGLSISFENSKAYYINIGHKDKKDQIDVDTVIEFLNFLHDKVLFIAHNIKYDLAILFKYGFKAPKKIFDTIVSSWIIEPSIGRYGLDFLAFKYFNYTMQPIKELIGNRKSDQITFAEVDVDDAVFYSCEDSDMAHRLFLRNKKLLENDNNLGTAFYDIEMKLISVILKMEKRGVLLDVELLEQLKNSYSDRLDELKIFIYEIAGEEFNINSTKQLGKILFEKLAIPPVKKTKKGTFSTNEEVLLKLANDYEIAEKLLKYRTLNKLLTTYIEGLPALISPFDNRVHTSYNQTATITGRLSSSNPNLQNIPAKTDDGKEIRKAFIAPTNYKILAFDYSQIELRVMAVLSKDEHLINAYKNNEDIHSLTASKITGKSISEISSSDRRLAKVLNFGIIYGMKPYGVSKNASITVSAAKMFIENYFESFPAVKTYISNVIDEAIDRGYVETFFGRKREIKELLSSNKNMQEFGKRSALSTVIQGTAADIIKIAMLNVDKFLKENSLKSKMIMQIHDELVFEVHEDEIDFVIDNVKRIMEGVVDFEIPFLVDYDIGDNWFEAH